MRCGVLFFQQRFQCRPHRIEQSRLHRLGGVDAVVLKILWVGRDAAKPERHHRQLHRFRHAGEALLESKRVGFTVIGRDAHLEQHRRRACLARKRNHFSEIAAHRCERLPTQAVVSTEFNQYEFRLMLFERSGQALQTAGGGFAADAGIDDLLRVAFCLQSFPQQRNPAAFYIDAVGGAEAVAPDQNRRGGSLCGAECQ